MSAPQKDSCTGYVGTPTEVRCRSVTPSTGSDGRYWTHCSEVHLSALSGRGHLYYPAMDYDHTDGILYACEPTGTLGHASHRFSAIKGDSQTTFIPDGHTYLDCPYQAVGMLSDVEWMPLSGRTTYTEPYIDGFGVCDSNTLNSEQRPGWYVGGTRAISVCHFNDPVPESERRRQAEKYKALLQPQTPSPGTGGWDSAIWNSDGTRSDPDMNVPGHHHPDVEFPYWNCESSGQPTSQVGGCDFDATPRPSVRTIVDHQPYPNELLQRRLYQLDISGHNGSGGQSLVVPAEDSQYS